MIETDRDRRIATGATGLLGTFNRAEVLEAADVHVAQRLGALTGETSPEVLLAVALTVRAARLGSVCLPLRAVDQLQTVQSGDEEAASLPWPEPESWLVAVADSPLVSGGVLRLEDDVVYLDRHWREERQVSDDLVARLGAPARTVDGDLVTASLDRLFGTGWEEQRAAAAAAVGQLTTVLTGGPGTGKTASVARLLVLISEQQERLVGVPPRIAMAAPTGKAANRLQESVAREADTLGAPDRTRLEGLTASTLHRLLGWRGDNSTRFRHHRENPLPYDVIVVDEVSMVSLSQMARLLEAVRSDTRLILMGDPDQLASVEAGAVLADIVDGLASWATTPVQRLNHNHRIEGAGAVAAQALDALSRAVRADDADAALGVLTSGNPAVRLIDPEDQAAVAAARDEVVETAFQVTVLAEDWTADSDRAPVMRLLEDHRLLCAHREGVYGVSGWNRLIDRGVSERTGVAHYEEWYPGRPILITANDRGLGLSNGDLGVTVREPDGRLRVLIGDRDFATTRISGAETVHAMTVHKSQGSEARVVTVVLPPEDSPLLTRELFYTAITRAREEVRVIGTEAELRAAIGRRVARASGLKHRLEASAPNGGSLRAE